MIISSYNEIPYGTCQVAQIRPEGKGKFSGTLTVEGIPYGVFITRDVRRGVDERVWARVTITKEVSAAAIDVYASAIAEKALSSDEWGRVKVDLRDGETAYMRTWTHDLPNDRDIDAFLAEAARFIGAHIQEHYSLTTAAQTREADFFDDEDLEIPFF